MKDPLKVEIVEVFRSPNEMSEVISFMGAIVWVIACIVLFFRMDWFDDTIGRIMIIPCVFISGYLGNLLTVILLKIGIFVLLGYCLIKWIGG
jgi:hypothetical protein